MRTYFVIIMLTVLAIQNAQSQMAVNLNWKTITAEPDSVAWSNSKIDQSGSVITVGNTKNQNGDADLYIEKVDQIGNLEWSNTFDFSGGDDYGIDLTIDQSGNIYALGTFWNSSNQNFDVGVVKFSSSGSVNWYTAYNSPHDLHDIPSDIAIIDGSDKLVVCGGSEGAATDVDMLTMCLTMGSGSVLWAKRHNYANLKDAAVGVRTYPGGTILVVGASADSNGLFDNVAIRYDESGNGLDSTRTSMGVGIDEPRAIERDNQGNWYVTGYYLPQPQNAAIVVYKMDTLLNLIWSQTINPGNGLHQGNDLALDDQGNTYITGYTTNSQGKTECYTARVDQSGSLEWEKTYTLPNHNSKGLKLTIDSDGWIDVLGEATDGSETNLLLMRYSPNGHLSFARKIHLDGDQRATEVLVDYANHIYITGQTVGDTVDDFITMQYIWSQNQMPAVLNANGDPVYVNDEMIIRFNPDQMNLSAVDNIEKEFGLLSEFVNPQVIDSMNQFVDFDFGRQTCYKIFRSMTSNDTITVGRQGNLVRQPRLWSALNVQIPIDVNKDTLQDSLESLFPMIYYTDLNLFGKLASEPNDLHYDTLSNLHSTATYPNADVNVEPAWEIETGRPGIKVGVFDSGLEWDHEDFQFQGSSVVQDVWDFESNTSWITNPHADSGSHGTQVAGIIGAVRNNGLGVAGIAGGHDSSNTAFAQQGISLYGLRVTKSGVFMPPTLSYYTNAIYISTLSQGADYAYELDLQNHSLGMVAEDTMYNDSNITILRDAIHAAYRNGVAMFCARGNDKGNYIHLPATFDDKWVMNVTGTGSNGLYMNGSPSCEEDCGRGRNVDIAAPGNGCNIAKATEANLITNSHYAPFGGTSGSTPHVTGAGALLCSYLNDSNFTLAPEDIEWIIQLSATDIDSVGYDVKTGYGRLNVGAALQLVEKPDKKLEHHGTVSTSASVSFEATANVELIEGYENELFQAFQSGDYQMDRYKITAVVNHAIDTTDTIIANWTRNDQVTTFPKEVNGNLLPHEECFINSIDETQAMLEGYVYHVKTLGGTPIGWIPQDTTAAAAKLEYTLLIHPKSLYIDSTGDTTGDTSTVISKLTSQGNGVLIYPNPATNSQQLEINLTQQVFVSHYLRGVDGSLIRTRDMGMLTEGHHTYTVDLNDLPQGIYFHEIQLGEERIIKRFAHL
ncbi:MAG: S8 family serine peptidase [Salibacteraceae bacterium]